ncbi:hypothetical protein SAY87_000073 [Trapa incisa]|uniref:Uncharacterized protein n=1 Tax=Trapa incisa TaxID=236973 RepID=A0AAN7JGC2_9MYRT|nr:hypothetical protein SAY87_000073 [Trapa incisa]
MVIEIPRTTTDLPRCPSRSGGGILCLRDFGSCSVVFSERQTRDVDTSVWCRKQAPEMTSPETPGLSTCRARSMGRRRRRRRRRRRFLSGGESDAYLESCHAAENDSDQAFSLNMLLCFVRPENRLHTPSSKRRKKKEKGITYKGQWGCLVWK